MDIKYLEAIRSLSQNLTSRLTEFPDELQKTVREVCIRADKPAAVCTQDGVYFLKQAGGFSKHTPILPYLTPKEEVFDCVRMLTQYSLHSCKAEINAGFITIKGGHRAGVAGSCVYDNGKISSVTDISSINLRVARQINGVASDLMRRLYMGGVSSTLIAGPPASGKTTLLRDMACCFSNGTLPFAVKLSLVDERGEVAAVYRGVPQNDVGIQTDVFDGYHKGDGMRLAIRSMTPQVILLDELGGDDDAAAVEQGLNAGVSVIATVHAKSMDELYRKKSICRLLVNGGFEHIVLLDSAKTPCTIKEICTPKELVLC